MDSSELPPTESDRVRRRDRKRVTAMVVDGGNVRRQLEWLQARAWQRRQQEREQLHKSPPSQSSETRPS
jgi:hypothetical protein